MKSLTILGNTSATSHGSHVRRHLGLAQTWGPRFLLNAEAYGYGAPAWENILRDSDLEGSDPVVVAKPTS